MMPGPPGSFYYHTAGLLSCLMGGQAESITISYEGPLCSPHPLRGPLFVVVHLYAAPQHLGFRVGVPDRGYRAFSGLIGPGLCRMLHTNFGEFHTSRYFDE